HRHGVVGRGHLELAARGVEFLTTRMWDSRSGGFVSELTPDGRPLVGRKRTVDQAFALYALLEYALASGDRAVLGHAEGAFEFIRAAAGHDDGFAEYCTPDPAVPAGGARGPWILSVQCHVMTALTLLAPISGNPHHALALRRLRDLLFSRAVDRRGCAFDR